MDFDATPYLNGSFTSVSGIKYWWDYVTDCWEVAMRDTKKSFRSLLASKNLHWVNPFGDMPNIIDYFDDEHGYHFDLSDWQQAEASLIRGKIAILKKL